MENFLQIIAVNAIPVLLAITLHEAAHGYVAKLFGDMTAYVAGRITLNPMKHIDPVGTIAVPLVILLTSKLAGGPAMLFGWAKPVPVDIGSLGKPKRDMIFVAAAGPAANLLMAIGWVLFDNALRFFGSQEDFFYLVAQAGVNVNLVLMALNLLPIPPLDGGRIMIGLLPHRASYAFSRVEPYGLFIVIGLMVTQTLGFFLTPFLQFGVAVLRLFN
jgi:Zn-dependent protease